MGSLTSRTTKCEGGSPNFRQTIRDDAPEMVVPRTPDDSVFDEHPPVFRRLETFEEKFYRKFTEEPLVPIGLVITAGFLINGIRAFYRQNRAKQQFMMRGRVAAQFCTVVAIMFYAGRSGAGVDWRLAPLHQDSVAIRQQKQQEAAEKAAAAAAVAASKSDK